MIEILGIRYITSKEASQRYGYSVAWFERERWKKAGPPFIRMEGRKGKIYYPVAATEDWFKEHMVKPFE